jgi:hypothetical protein
MSFIRRMFIPTRLWDDAKDLMQIYETSKDAKEGHPDAHCPMCRIVGKSSKTEPFGPHPIACLQCGWIPTPPYGLKQEGGKFVP